MRYTVVKIGDEVLIEEYKRFPNYKESVDYFNVELCEETDGFKLNHSWMDDDLNSCGVCEINGYWLVDMEYHDSYCDPFNFLRNELISLF